MPSPKQIFQSLTDKFFARLERKTGWGKEEVKREYVAAASEVVSEIMDKNTEEFIKSMQEKL